MEHAVEQGALADPVLVDGDPIATIKVIEDPAKNFLMIMKDGKLHRDPRRRRTERERVAAE